jgi:hypothetical protein
MRIRAYLFINVGVLCISLFVLTIVAKNKLTSKIDESLLLISGIASTSYSSIDVNLLTGSAFINHLEVKPHDASFGIYSTDSISIRTSDKFYLLRYVFDIGQDTKSIPSSFEWMIKGLLIPYDAPAIRKLLEAQNSELLPDLQPNCGEEHTWTFSDMDALGYSHTPTDLSVSYEYQPGDHKFVISVTSEAKSMSSTNLEVEISGILGLEQKYFQKDYSANISVNHQDLGFGKRLLEYCAKEEGMSYQDYISQESTPNDQFFIDVFGAKANGKLKEAYRDFVSSPDSIQLDFQLSSEDEIHDFQHYQLNDLVYLLNVTLSVNKKPIEIEFIPVDVKVGVKTVAEIDPEIKISTSRSGSEKNGVIEWSELPDYIGKEIAYITIRGEYKKATVLKVKADKVQLKIHQYGGETVQHVKRETVQIILLPRT